MSDLGDNNLMVLLGGISALFAVTFFFFVRSLMEGRARPPCRAASRPKRRVGDAGPQGNR